MTREGEILANLEHPWIVRFFELVEDAQGRAVVIMEWIEGGPLSAQLPFGPRSALFPTLHSWVGCVIQIADAVEAAHQAEVYHRDLKPSNVLLGQGAQPKLVDFGIGLDAAFEDDRLTRSGVVLGSQAYAAPEQRVPRSRVDPNETVAELVAVDVYGLGGILYEGLAGSPPHGFHGGARRAIPSPPSAIRRPSWDARLEGILMKALEAKPERRYLSARELGQDLRAWLAGERVLARSFGPMKRLAWHLRQGLRPTKLREGAD